MRSISRNFQERNYTVNKTGRSFDMTRIKYTKQKDGKLKSCLMVTKKNVAYFATICYLSGEWKIFNAKRRNVVRKGFSTNKNVIRGAVRREFIKLGVRLENESSKKGYAKTKSGR
jgi:hypothetical protein